MEKDYKIIDYSANAMDNEQKSAFEMELENDQFSQKEIEEYRLIFKGLEAIGDQEPPLVAPIRSTALSALAEPPVTT